MTIPVFLVNDHNIVRDGIVRIVDSEPDLTVTGQAGSAAEGRALLNTGEADVLVVDVTMPDGSGLDLIREARAAYPNMGILVLTMHEDEDPLLGALETWVLEPADRSLVPPQVAAPSAPSNSGSAYGQRD